ncbi:MAG: stage III sporulation protein AB [Acetivibrio sp.]
MVLKILGSVFIIFSTSFLGYLLGMEKKNRLKQLRQLKKAGYLLRGEIQYGYTPLPEALINLGERSQTVFSDFFISVAEKLKKYEGESFYGIWEKEIKENLIKTSLQVGDKKKLMALGENLGYLDQEMQIKNIDLYLDGLEEEIKVEMNSQNEKIRLYQLLGVLSGIFVTIVML